MLRLQMHNTHALPPEALPMCAAGLYGMGRASCLETQKAMSGLPLSIIAYPAGRKRGSRSSKGGGSTGRRSASWGRGSSRGRKAKRPKYEWENGDEEEDEASDGETGEPPSVRKCSVARKRLEHVLQE